MHRFGANIVGMLSVRLLFVGTLMATRMVAEAPVPPAAPLAPASREKIARMTPLFDGRSLAGWIQAPPAPLTFSPGDLTDAVTIAKRVDARSDAIAVLIGNQLDEAGNSDVASLVASGGGDPKAAASAMAKALNKLVTGPPMYDPVRFKGVRLRAQTDMLRRKEPRGQELARLNRLLLEDIFAMEIAASADASWEVHDGTIASTGAGRGVIYTERDFAHYRLIFTMRHVSGKPDHQPCFLIFGTRPAAGERGLDALGGIQFQTPNGGHWDYRPGHNNSGTAFSNPHGTKTTFDNHEWHQVEILVNAKDGTARMAVAQPVGTRAIENLNFHDPEAGKAGPIAWQMHNAGLFDEYKDVRIEVDPAEERLITTDP